MAALRKLIEERLGEAIFEKLSERGDCTTVPIMVPPIPDSKFIDKLPKGAPNSIQVTEKEHQDAYEAEVKLYRSLEEMKRGYLVIHQLEFTHEQYSSFHPSHLCDKKRCKVGSKDHRCHRKAKEIEGECDLVVVGNKFVAIIEVKGLGLQGDEKDSQKIKGCCLSAIAQRKRMKELAHAIDSSMIIFEFTAFPNISIKEIDDQYLKNETLLFSDDVRHLTAIMECCETYASLQTLSRDMGKARGKMCRCLLGMWLINVENKWEFSKCDITYCIQDISQKLRNAIVTRKLMDNEKQIPKKRKSAS